MTEITLYAHNNTLIDPLDEYQLTGGMAVSEDTHIPILELSPMNLGILKSRDNIAQSISTTYITLTRGFADDVAGNEVEPVNKFQACNFSDDITKPELESFH